MDQAILKNSMPKSFCREFAEIRESTCQLGMYMALVLGMKPLMDEWIPIKKLPEFKKVCRQYGIFIREDVIFKNVKKIDLPSNILGRDCLTTTSALAYQMNTNMEGEAHLFLSKQKKLLSFGMWYPVIIKDRVIFQPVADTLKYGYALGYPDCCIKFFKQFNNWKKYSHLYEAFKNTPLSASYLCNPFLKDTSFSYIYHMPCSYHCQKSLKIATALRNEIKKREPGFVRFYDERLKRPSLVFYERKFYSFEGICKDGKITYSKTYFPSPDKKQNIYQDSIEKGDALTVCGRDVIIFKKHKKIATLNIPLNDFAPEYPFVISFV